MIPLDQFKPKCPACDSEHRFTVAVSSDVVIESGAEPILGVLYVDADAHCCCMACLNEGEASDFQTYKEFDSRCRSGFFTS